MAVSATTCSSSAGAAEDDPLQPLVAEFLNRKGYPTDANKTDIAEREQMAAVISEEGLLGFDLPEFRRIYNTTRYGSPGPQSILNASLSQMSPEQLDLFANNLEYLLRGDAPLEERFDSLMDQNDRGIRGLGEAVLTKLLANTDLRSQHSPMGECSGMFLEDIAPHLDAQY